MSLVWLHVSDCLIEHSATLVISILRLRFRARFCITVLLSVVPHMQLNC